MDEVFHDVYSMTVDDISVSPVVGSQKPAKISLSWHIPPRISAALAKPASGSMLEVHLDLELSKKLLAHLRMALSAMD